MNPSFAYDSQSEAESWLYTVPRTALRFEPPRQDEGRSAEEVAVLHYLRRVLREDSRPADLESAAGLRWRLDCALLDLKLPDPRGVYHPPALRGQHDLTTGRAHLGPGPSSCVRGARGLRGAASPRARVSSGRTP